MKLPPCPFCEGPPVPVVVRVLNGGGCFPDSELEGDDGLYVKSYVFCHECGAQGPAVDDIAFSRAECDALERQAVALWYGRGAKNRGLYDSGEREGLNEYPRADEPAAAFLFEGSPMSSEMQPHQQRVVNEKTELDVKIAALTAFINTFDAPFSKFAALPDPERQRLYTQQHAMIVYSGILAERIAAF